MLEADKPIGQLAVENPASTAVFEQLGIDYCCGGQKSLSEACKDKGLNVQAVLESIRAAAPHPQEPNRDWSKATMTELTEHIENTHHAYLKRELPRLDSLTRKVADRHGQKHPEMQRVRDIFMNFKAELESHMAKEELILFPLCRRLETERRPFPMHCGSVQNPIRVMIAEHEDAGGALEQFRNLTGNYIPPSDACDSYRLLLSSLQHLQADMHLHIHKENNILFPQAIEAESRLLMLNT